MCDKLPVICIIKTGAQLFRSMPSKMFLKLEEQVKRTTKSTASRLQSKQHAENYKRNVDTNAPQSISFLTLKRKIFIFCKLPKGLKLSSYRTADMEH
jgi:hypothetical protein